MIKRIFHAILNGFITFGVGMAAGFGIGFGVIAIFDVDTSLWLRIFIAAALIVAIAADFLREERDDDGGKETE
ncbi:hypothetical protein [Paenibacillus abyssi]|uniref:Uncharacterized protein n=1 Tax=Paenibacillus abyssi TaxID=1340531 RepID=A0A917FJ23_9BACL|nr:hypothetical protein [Paenibacillus abyssi]GGF88217.1 hypothetical protein GCM10010916_01900 [Paenibacillus abyssi]